MLYALSHAIAAGKKAGYASAFGLATGNSFHVLLNAFGLSFLFVRYPVLCTIIKYAGALYLLYLGGTYINNSRKKLATDLPDEKTHVSVKAISYYNKGIVVEFLNPKTALFYISILPQFINPDKGSLTMQMLMLGICVPTTALFVDLSVSYFAGTLKTRILAGKFRNKIHEVVSGVLLIAMGGFLLFT